MRKLFLLSLIMLISLISLPNNQTNQINNSFLLSNEYLEVEISKETGFIESLKQKGIDKSLFSSHRFIISGIEFKNEIIELSENSISFLSTTDDYTIMTKYYLEHNEVVIMTKITNKTNTNKKIQINEIIDYSDTYPFFRSPKIFENYAFLLQQDYGSLGYFNLNSSSFQRLISNDAFTTSISFFDINPNEAIELNRTVSVDRSVSEIEKKYFDKFNIPYNTFEKDIILNTEKSSQGIRVILEDELNKILSVQIVDDKGKAKFYIPLEKNYHNYKMKVDHGNLKTEPIDILTSKDIFIEVPENYFYYKPFLTVKKEDGITVNFRTAVPARSKISVYSLKENSIIMEVQNNLPLEYHNIEISTLNSNTTYYYVVNVEDTYTINKLETEKKSFSTKPLDKDIKSFQFVVYGDTQIYDERHTFVVEKILENEELKPIFIIKPGDHTEEGTSENSWHNFLESTYPLSSQIPYYLVLGNHERNSLLYYRAFALPKGGGDYSKRWYSFDYGNAHFIILDSNILESSSLYKKQMEWLENDLKDNQDKKFTFVIFHHPFWTTATEYGSMEENLPQGHFNTKNWLPLFKKYNVDVVINGHIHAYERHFRDGIMFITTGGGGAKLNTSHEANPLPWHVKHVLAKLHYILFEVFEDSIKVTVKAVAEIDNPLFPNEYTEINEIIDEFYIYKK